MHSEHADDVRPLDSASGAGEATRNGGASSSTTVEEGNKNGEEESREETRKPQIARRPYTPTAAEVEAHLSLHLEFRSWWPHCVAGKQNATQHRKSIGEVTELGVTLSLDYCFMTAEEAGDDMRAILIAYDHSKSGLWALPVEHNGVQDAGAVKWIVDKPEENGYAGIPVTIKSDQEPAMIKLKQAIAVRRKPRRP